MEQNSRIKEICPHSISKLGGMWIRAGVQHNTTADQIIFSPFLMEEF